MAIAFGDKETKNVGSWQEFFVPTYSERIKRLRENAIRTPEICLERAAHRDEGLRAIQG